jgi:hypothetical protein
MRRRAVRGLTLFSLLCLGLATASGPAYACPAKGAIFQDSFTDQTGGWEAGSEFSFGPTGLTFVIPAANLNFAELNASFFATDGDYCTDVSFPTAVPNVAYAGLIFWATDYNNYFLFQVSTGGHAQLYRRANAQWAQVIDMPLPAIKTAAGASNEVRAVAKGNLITLYVNGQKIADRRAQVPTTGNLRFGMWTQIDSTAPADNARTFHFKDYTVN